MSDHLLIIFVLSAVGGAAAVAVTVALRGLVSIQQRPPPRTPPEESAFIQGSYLGATNARRQAAAALGLPVDDATWQECLDRMLVLQAESRKESTPRV